MLGWTEGELCLHNVYSPLHHCHHTEISQYPLKVEMANEI